MIETFSVIDDHFKEMFCRRNENRLVTLSQIEEDFEVKYYTYEIYRFFST